MLTTRDLNDILCLLDALEWQTVGHPVVRAGDEPLEHQAALSLYSLFCAGGSWELERRLLSGAGSGSFEVYRDGIKCEVLDSVASLARQAADIKASVYESVIGSLCAQGAIDCEHTIHRHPYDLWQNSTVEPCSEHHSLWQELQYADLHVVFEAIKIRRERVLDLQRDLARYDLHERIHFFLRFRTHDESELAIYEPYTPAQCQTLLEQGMMTQREYDILTQSSDAKSNPGPPTSGEGQASQSTATPDATHTPDFRSVAWFGQRYTFTATQAACIKVLWRHWEAGTPIVSGDAIIAEAESTSRFLSDVFSGHSAWGTMIVLPKKGTYSLSDPGEK